jgi:hypothetical protein
MSDAELSAPTGEQSTTATVIESDLHCIRCGYNLRTLSVEGRCPECGSLVCETIDADLPGRWRKRVRAGLLLLMLQNLHGLVSSAIYATLFSLFGTANWPQSIFPLLQYMSCLHRLPMLVALVGAVLLTRRPPDAPRQSGLDYLVWSIRLLMIVPVLHFAVPMVAPPGNSALLFAALNTAIGWSGFLGTGLICYYIAKNIPAIPPVTRLLRVIIPLLIFGGLSLAFSMTEFVRLQNNPGSEPRPWLYVLMHILAGTHCIVMLMILVRARRGVKAGRSISPPPLTQHASISNP